MPIVPGDINRKILLLTLSLVAGACLIIGLTALFVFYEHSVSTTLTSNKEIAGHVAAEVNLIMQNALRDNERTAHRLGKEDSNSHEIMEILKLGSGNFDGLAYVNNSGRIVNFYPENPDIIGATVEERDWYKEVIRTKKPFISEPYYAKTGNLVLVIVNPVKDSKGQVIGVLSGSFHLVKSNKLRQFIQTLKVGETGYAAILSKDGNFIHHPDLKKITQSAGDGEAVRQVLGGKTGALSIANESGTVMLTGFAPIHEMGWGVLVQIPRDEALASAKTLRGMLFMIVVGISVVVVVVTFLEVRRITEPLTHLMRGVHRVTEGDYNVEIAVASDDEIGTLTRDFNTMVDRIRLMRLDIEEKQKALKEKNEELEVLSITDGLTRLYNHRHFQERFEKEILRAQREQVGMSLMLVDIDHFKYYNDLFGHHAGDRLLQEISQVIKECLAPQDFLARYGGEEFAVIMPETGVNEAFDKAEEIRRAIEGHPFKGGNQQPNGKITVSIGLANYPINAQSKEELFKKTDEALYKAKCCSRNKVEMYFSVLDELNSDLNQSEVELINSIKMLVRIINAKDKYTYGHSERVSRYAVAIARKMNFSEEELKHLKLGAFLHDIGKIEVSRGILTKRGALTFEEFDIIKKHPFWGAAIIKAVEALAPTLPIIKFHHERMDGSGYPLGLKGEEIPLAARILAVADSFDAMTSNRPYRARKSFDNAIQELVNNAGTLFDPRVVEVFVDFLNEEYGEDMVAQA